MYFDCVISKEVIFGKKFDQKGTFWAFLHEKRHFWGFLAHFFIITASLKPTKVNKLSKGILMFKVLYDHVFIIYF